MEGRGQVAAVSAAGCRLSYFLCGCTGWRIDGISCGAGQEFGRIWHQRGEELGELLVHRRQRGLRAWRTRPYDDSGRFLEEGLVSKK